MFFSCLILKLVNVVINNRAELNDESQDKVFISDYQLFNPSCRITLLTCLLKHTMDSVVPILAKSFTAIRYGPSCPHIDDIFIRREFLQPSLCAICEIQVYNLKGYGTLIQ